MTSMKPKSRGTCLDCGEPKRVPLYEDPRVPPLDTEPCLCRDCAIAAYEQVIDEGEKSIHDLSHNLKLLRSYVQTAKRERDPQKARLAAKEEQKGREVVDCVARIIIPSSRHMDHNRVVEAALQCTRDELNLIQKAHAKDTLIINYIREDKP